MTSRVAPLAWLGALLVLFAASLTLAAYFGYRMLTQPGTTTTATSLEAEPRPPTSAPRFTRVTPRRSAPPVSSVARVPPPVYSPSDAHLTAEAAFRDMRAALDRADAGAAAKYVLAAKLAQMASVEQALSELTPLAAQKVRITKSTQRGNKAALFVRAESRDVTSADGKPAAIDVVVQMLREDGHWKVFRQLWLVNTPPADYQREAIAWLGAAAPAGDEAGAALRRLEALGVTYDAMSFQSAVARHDAALVRLFLRAGMSPKTKVSSSDESLFSLALLGMPGGGDAEAVVLAMIEAGAPLEERTATGLTALARAVVFCRPSVVEALMRAGASVSATDNDGRTPQAWAKMTCPAVAPVLRGAGAR